MNNRSLTPTTAFTLSAVILLSSCGGGLVNNPKDSVAASTKLDSASVPKVVTESFEKAFPTTTYVDWYSYPGFNNDTDRYQYEPTYFSNKPSDNYFIAEFTHKDTLSRAVYDKNGKSVAVHRKLKGDLPAPIVDSIKKSDYSSWTVGQDKEEIFKDPVQDQITIYRVVMQKGDQKHTLYFQQNGKMVKDVKVS